MCRGKDHKGGRRCPVTPRSRAMATARRRILRAKAEISSSSEKGSLSPEREHELYDKILKATALLGEAKRIKEDE